MTKGRKRKTGRREPNGKLSRRQDDRQARRSIEQADMMAPARSARERIHGIPASESGTELAGTTIGRMLLRGLVTRRQFDAAQIVAERHRAYSGALALASGSARAVDIHGIRGGNLGVPMSDEAILTTIGRWDEVVMAMDEAGRLGQLYALVWRVVVADRDPPPNISPLLLRVALEAVADKCGLLLGSLLTTPAEAA